MSIETAVNEFAITPAVDLKFAPDKVVVLIKGINEPDTAVRPRWFTLFLKNESNAPIVTALVASVP